MKIEKVVQVIKEMDALVTLKEGEGLPSAETVAVLNYWRGELRDAIAVDLSPDPRLAIRCGICGVPWQTEAGEPEHAVISPTCPGRKLDAGIASPVKPG